ncbi:MAG: YfdQ family protein [Solirubrobacteraceae bacterium]|nr:YfdQ family protein [Solirubrobacteraceae bacterium]
MSESTTIDSDVREIERLTERAVGLAALGTEADAGFVTTIVPDEHKVVLIDGERLDGVEDRPWHSRGTVVVGTVDTFTRYVNLHASDDATTVWIQHDEDDLGTTTASIGEVVAVIDDHAPDLAGWGEHRAVLPLRTTREWRHWVGHDAVMLGQQEFANHLRQGLQAVIDPDHATILEVAEALVVTQSSSLESIARSSGQLHITTHREAKGRIAGGKEETEVPETFRLRIAPFLDRDPVEIEARLHYRQVGDTLALGYVLTAPAAALERAVRHVTETVELGIDSPAVRDRIYRGTPATTDQRRRPMPRATSA